MYDYVTLISLAGKVFFYPEGLEKCQDRARKVGAPCRMPCRVRKEVWLGSHKVRAPCRCWNHKKNTKSPSPLSKIRGGICTPRVKHGIVPQKIINIQKITKHFNTFSFRFYIHIFCNVTDIDRQKKYIQMYAFCSQTDISKYGVALLLKKYINTLEKLFVIHSFMFTLY